MSAAPTYADLDTPRFDAAQCDAVFAAILVDDVVRDDARLPAPFTFWPTQAQIVDGYRISRQLWQDGAKRHTLLELVAMLGRGQALNDEQQQVFKHIRAKFKQLRFAYALFDSRHRYPRLFHVVTSLLGSLQDAFKNGQHTRMRRLAWAARLLLLSLPYRHLDREIDTFRATTSEGFQQYTRAEIEKLHTGLAAHEFTRHEFHSLRKIIGRQSALCSVMTVLAPLPSYAALTAFIATINGRMGAFHDALVEQQFAQRRDAAGTRFPMPEPVRLLLTQFVEWHALI